MGVRLFRGACWRIAGSGIGPGTWLKGSNYRWRWRKIRFVQVVWTRVYSNAEKKCLIRSASSANPHVWHSMTTTRGGWAPKSNVFHTSNSVPSTSMSRRSMRPIWYFRRIVCDGLQNLVKHGLTLAVGWLGYVGCPEGNGGCDFDVTA